VTANYWKESMQSPGMDESKVLYRLKA